MNIQKACEQFQIPLPLSVQPLCKWLIVSSQATILQAGDEITGLYLLVEGRYYVTTKEVTGKELLLQNCDIQSDCTAATACSFIFIPLSVYVTYDFLQSERFSIG
ncbi:hypothetical protein [Paenibacillus brasilensis]|uniref:CRP-like cAMP-binding protein n=1 Tax=Paenibacillus brasilensis TaxID=128574 RepID=A0ABU0L351_9BACL|nr:hypothetical protein [Paenibacillus brasilensis]MDQ0495279.1 CRP-like cAMP-binding protein [Paenibacillus brasilensis]